jgi:ABC-2 type transport system permease protein
VPQLLIYIGAVFTRTDGFTGAMHELGDMGPGLASALIRALVLASIALLAASTTGRRAFAAAFIVGVFVITAPVVGILSVLGNQTINQLAFLVNPMTLLGSFEQWLFGRQQGAGGFPIGDYGPLYGAATVAVLALALSLLLARYRKVAA